MLAYIQTTWTTSHSTSVIIGLCHIINSNHTKLILVEPETITETVYHLISCIFGAVNEQKLKELETLLWNLYGENDEQKAKEAKRQVRQRLLAIQRQTYDPQRSIICAYVGSAYVSEGYVQPDEAVLNCDPRLGCKPFVHSFKPFYEESLRCVWRDESGCSFTTWSYLTSLFGLYAGEEHNTLVLV